MPLLLIPLLIVGFVLLWALLLPLSLIQRYRSGKARRRVQGWVAFTNAGLLSLSLAMFFVSACLALLWEQSLTSWASVLTAGHALAYAIAGASCGALLGLLGLALSRFEVKQGSLYYTANRWLVLSLTLLVAARIALLFWQLWMHWRTADAELTKLVDNPFLDHRSVFAAGGLLLGYYWLYTWGLYLRHRQMTRANRSR